MNATNLTVVPDDDDGDGYGEAAEIVEFRDAVTGRPNLDPEAGALCALMQTPADLAHLVAAHLRPEDFYRPAHGELYAVILDLVTTGKPHTAQAVMAKLEQTGRIGGHLSKILLDVVTADAIGADATHLAYAVIAAAYRRGYTIAADRLKQHAAETDADELFEAMCELGRERREAEARFVAAREALQ